MITFVMTLWTNALQVGDSGGRNSKKNTKMASQQDMFGG